jgi:hypothetical protein
MLREPTGWIGLYIYLFTSVSSDWTGLNSVPVLALGGPERTGLYAFFALVSRFNQPEPLSSHNRCFETEPSMFAIFLRGCCSPAARLVHQNDFGND